MRLLPTDRAAKEDHLLAAGLPLATTLRRALAVNMMDDDVVVLLIKV